MRVSRCSLLMSRAANGAARGFTLIELLVTVAVAALLAALAIPSYRNVVQNNARDSVLNGLSGALNYARNASLRTNAPVSVCALGAATGSCGSDWNNGWMVSTDPVSASTVVLMTKPALAADGPRISTSVGSAGVRFNPDGLASTKAEFLVCDNRGSSAAKGLEVLVTGYVQMSAQPGQKADGSSAACP